MQLIESFLKTQLLKRIPAVQPGAGGIGFYIIVNKTDFICFKEGTVSTSSGRLLKLVRPIPLLWQEYPIYWNWRQHTYRKRVDCNRQVIDRIEIWYLWWNKIGFLPSCGCVSTTVCMYHLDVNKPNKKSDVKYIRMLHAVSTKSRKKPYKTVAAQPPTSHLTNQPNQTNKTCRALFESIKCFLFFICLLFREIQDEKFYWKTFRVSKNINIYNW